MKQRVQLFYNYYKSPIPERNKELYYCFRALLNNEAIDTLYIITSETGVETGDRGFILPYPHQPTFRELMASANHFTRNNDINIFINSDCFMLKNDIEVVKANICDCEVYCLTRWEVLSLNPFQTQHYDNPYSQDCWIIKGKYPPILDGNYRMGQPGCDNALAFELCQAGLVLKNPTFDVKVYHLHPSGIRTFNDLSFYNDRKRVNRYRVKKPFQEVKYTEL